MYIKFTYLTLVQIDLLFVCSLSSPAPSLYFLMLFLHTLFSLYAHLFYAAISTYITASPTLRSWAYHI